MPVNISAIATNLSAKSVAAHIEMEMIPMRNVVIGAQNSTKSLAGAAVNSREKLPFVAAAFPMAFDRDTPTIIEHKAGNINGIGMSVL